MKDPTEKEVHFKRSYSFTGWRADVAMAVVVLLLLAVLFGFVALVLWMFGLQVVRA